MITIEGNKIALYQWDLNQRLILTDVGSNVKVHFSSYYGNHDSLPVLTYEQNGKMYCDIPNILLQERGIIYAYLYASENDKLHTKQSVEILVIPRKKPADYVYSETEIVSIEKAVEEALNKCKESGDFTGLTGASAFEIAVKNGFEGTEAEWLESLRGDKGKMPVKGVDYFTAEDKAELIEEVISILPIWNGGEY